MVPLVTTLTSITNTPTSLPAQATILEYKPLIEESISSSFSKSRYIKMMKVRY